MTHFAGSHPPINPLPVGVGSATITPGESLSLCQPFPIMIGPVLIFLPYGLRVV